MNEKNFQRLKFSLQYKKQMSVLTTMCFLMFPSEELRQGRIARSFVSVFFHSGNRLSSLAPISQLPCKIPMKVNRHTKMHITYCDTLMRAPDIALLYYCIVEVQTVLAQNQILCFILSSLLLPSTTANEQLTFLQGFTATYCVQALYECLYKQCLI